MGEGLISFQVRLSELTATLNKNSSTNSVGKGENPSTPDRQLGRKSSTFSGISLRVGRSFKGRLHLKYVICDTHSGIKVHMKQTGLFTVDS